MGGMLVDSKNDCCCPEMRCCTPTTVTATVSGMSGQTMRGYVSLGNLDYLSRSMSEIVCQPGKPVFVHSAFDAFVLMGKPTTFQYSTIQSMAACGGGEFWTYWEDAINPWPPSAFPPVGSYVVEMYEDMYEGWKEQFTDFRWLWIGYYIVPDNLEMRWVTDNTLCEVSGLLCSRPTPAGLHSGPCQGVNGFSPTIISNENDLNGTYVLHRPELYLRPQLKCRINRQVPLTESPYRGVTEAQLLYNVDPKREWFYRNENLPSPNECWDVLFPPEGDEYVVDYRCDKRNPWYSASGFTYCARGKCTVTNQGVAKPHLYYYHEDLSPGSTSAEVGQMQSADLYLKLIPRDYEVDTHGRFPTWWRVGSVQILDGGYGYAVGDFFFVDFDIRRAWLGGEIMTVFPKTDTVTCLLPYYPTWVDEYGYSGRERTAATGEPVWELFQRLRVTAVDENGGITAVEVVPIYKNPEYKDPPLCMSTKTRAEQTKFYVGYGRVLCHPRSVQLPGVGYTVGDTIEWYCDDPPCEVLENAIAVVTDVDEEGGILDWEIRGTDAWRYNSQNFCVSPFTIVDGVCTTSCIKEGEPDERGKYRWKANLLCDLTWTGIGVPARAASLPTNSFSTKVADYDHPWFQQTANLSGLTTLTLRISRVQCETSIQAYVFEFPFDEGEGGLERANFLFPPYPRCAGGGAVVRPQFGVWGGNESDFGSYLAGGFVEAGGGNYCYREKRHVAPVLPTAVPSVGGGTGATIAGYSFTAVHNYPNPAIDHGGDTPASDRFSYFPVTAATVGEAGAGYTVGQTFEVSPAGGRAVSDMWRATGGDTPEECPNGAWYDGERATVNAAGYRSLAYNYETGAYLEPVSTRPSKCTLRVAAVNASGGITSLEVVDGGMMFRTEWLVGKRNPLVAMFLRSTLGYGAGVAGTFDTNHESDHFGELVSVSVVAPPAGTGDPKHPGVSDGEGGWIEPPGLMPTGGRDYADQSAGYFWMLQNADVGGPVCPTWQLLAHIGWGGRSSIFGTVMPSPPGGDVSEPRAPRNYFHEAYSTHTVISGGMPSFVPMSSVCAFSDCYHDLLTRTYPLVKTWGGSCPQNGVDGFGGPRMPVSNGSYAVLRRKGRNSETAKGSDYHVVEYGPQLSLGYSTPSPCPDHSNGTPSRE